MPDQDVRGETHGCIVCGKPYQLYVVYDSNGKFVDAKVMTAGARLVRAARRPLVACNRHTQADVERAVERVYGEQSKEDD